jgi:saccharopine dehydrogenase-like NADP-dependent oxidoreductase
LTVNLRTVVIGGYGNFGRVICTRLKRIAGVELIVAGRDQTSARRCAMELGAQAAVLDTQQPDLAHRLRALDAQLVISTAGPFQHQGHGVPRACIDAGAHYIDIADARRYVCDITTLDPAARDRGVLIVSGASSVPALSAAVVDHFSPEFASLLDIEHGICSSQRLPGIATVAAVLGYCGQPFEQWHDGRWRAVHGWQDLRRVQLAQPVGPRWFANCDVPDLELFPTRYPNVRSVSFQAGLGLQVMHLSLWLLARLRRTGLLPPLQRFSSLLHGSGVRLERFGDGCSGMFVRMRGVGVDGSPHERRWQLLAGSNHGQNIPCLAAVALTRKLVRETLPQRGAMPCVGLLSLDEYLAELQGLDVRTQID